MYSCVINFNVPTYCVHLLDGGAYDWSNSDKRIKLHIELIAHICYMYLQIALATITATIFFRSIAQRNYLIIRPPNLC